MKNVYFLSDAHLGSWAIDHRRTHERRLVRFLDSIKHRASAVYLLGDMFDFWNEYRYVVPKGYTRFLGKISELTDLGVEVHYFIGNHDIWTYGYLEQECGVILHRKPLTTEIYGKVFYLAHGDGLGDPDHKFQLLRKVFHNSICQHLFNAIHPRWGMWLGQTWAKHSRLKRKEGKEPPYMGEDHEFLVQFTKQYMQAHDNVDYYIYGHRHIELDLMLSRQVRMFIIGDWITQFTYVVYDGEHIFMEQYIEGESQP
ncbi:UDP-2,3-diacylglucosamine diphosphatase [Hoylesella timonensis]|uniref:UDP-2,3-diacylglucosamine hydrolase n=1 Tax=Hoylesella timonensis S9-PR14 TaxID=1401062 RepID=A0A098YV15_9BACT|nr:UDP-2,3-diacylglucosamine diphosphatase [Hoylesella timonensis]KGI23199.1 UDP-2,3-diacylglucosamine hydrolase [Hoylesella timonensis S9-PR14]